MRSGEIGGTSRRSIGGLARPLALGVMVTMLMVLGTSTARADCPPTDPACATGVVDDAQQNVNDAAADPTGTADDAVKQAQDTAGGAVDTVTDTVDGILNPPGDDGGGPGGGGGNGGNGGNHGGNGGNGTSTGTTGGLGGSTTAPGATLLPTTLTGATVDGQAPTGGRRGGHGVLGQFGDVIARAARQVAFPLALTLIVVAFLLIQNRLDRRDPKLAFAPIGPDVLPFD